MVRKAYANASMGDFERFFENFAEDAVRYDADSLPYGGVFHGKTGMQELSAKMFAAWESANWTIKEIAAGDDVVFVHLHMTFKPRGGTAVSHPIVELWRFANGRIVEFRPYYYDTKLISEVLAAHP